MLVKETIFFEALCKLCHLLLLLLFFDIFIFQEMSFKFVQNLIFFLAKMVKDHGLKVYIGHDGIGLLFYWGATSRHIRILPLWKILLSPSENGNFFFLP